MLLAAGALATLLVLLALPPLLLVLLARAKTTKRDRAVAAVLCDACVQTEAPVSRDASTGPLAPARRDADAQTEAPAVWAPRVGEQVWFWSETLRTWLQVAVLGSGASGYQLGVAAPGAGGQPAASVKNHAPREKLRPLLACPGAPLHPGPWGRFHFWAQPTGLAVHLSSVPARAVDVRYYSATHARWIDAALHAQPDGTFSLYARGPAPHTIKHSADKARIAFDGRPDLRLQGLVSRLEFTALDEWLAPPAGQPPLPGQIDNLAQALRTNGLIEAALHLAPSCSAEVATATLRLAKLVPASDEPTPGAALMRAAQVWAPGSHGLFHAEARRRAKALLLSCPAALRRDVWVEHVLPFAIDRAE